MYGDTDRSILIKARTHTSICATSLSVVLKEDRVLVGHGRQANKTV